MQKVKTVLKIITICFFLLFVGNIYIQQDSDTIYAETYTGACGENLTWEFDDVTCELTIKGTGDMTTYSNSSPAPWNKYKGTITSIIINDGVTSISSYAFSKCANIKNIIIPNSVTSIGASAFSGCTNIQSITLPFIGKNKTATTTSSATLFGYIFGTSNYTGGVATKQYHNSGSSSYVTYYIPSALREVVVTGDDVASIGNYAFNGCTNLRKITITNSVTSIGNYTFKDCANLKEVIFEENTKLTKIGSYAFYGCRNINSITIPDSVTNIENYAFFGCSNLKEVILEANSQLTSIGDYLFKNCTSLESITIPKSVKSIGYESFYNCKNLQEVNFEADGQLTSIGASAFKGCNNLQSITIPNNVTTISNDAFNGCLTLESVLIPNRVTSIGASAFDGCTNLQEVIFGENSQLTSIGSYTFSGCKNIKSIIIPDGITSIGDYSFKNCENLENITIPKGVKSIGASAFSGCTSLVNIEIPSGVTSIGKNAFSDCTNLTNFKINDLENSISIGEDIFANSNNIKYIYFGKGISSVAIFSLDLQTKLEKIEVSDNNQNYSSDNNGVLFNKDKTTLIKYPQNRTWSYYSIPESVVTLATNAFLNCSNLEGLLMPKSITSIDTNAVKGCSSTTAYVYADTSAKTYADSKLSTGDLASVETMDYMVLTGIQVAQAPFNEEYVVDGDFDFDGLQVLAIYGETLIAIDDYTLEYDNSVIGPQTVIVKYDTFTTSFDIIVKDRASVGIEINKLPDRVEFVEGMEVDKTGLEVNLIYDNGAKKLITDYTISYPPLTMIGTLKVTVTYGSFTTDYTINVIKRVAVGIVLDTTNVSKVYEVDQPINVESLIVKLLYNDNTTEVITDYNVEKFDNTSIGKKEIKITYSGFRETIKVEVVRKTNNANPVAAQMSSRTNTSIELVSVEGYEYSLDGINWQASTLFKDLLPNKEYTFYQRIAKNETTQASKTSEAVKIKTLCPIEGDVTITGSYFYGGIVSADTSKMLPTEAAVKYEWYRNGILIPSANEKDYLITEADISQKITVKVIGVGEYSNFVESDNIIPTKAPQPKPAAPKENIIGAFEVVLSNEVGYEYSIDGINWQESPTFNNLKYSTSYSFYQRKAETQTHKVSESSDALVITTKPCPHNDLQHYNQQKPTCTEKGWEAYDICKVCGNSTYVEIPVLDHYEGEIVNENIINSTCKASGSHDEVVYCTECNKELSRTNVVDNKLEHTFNQQVVNDTYLISKADCQHKATYYYSCECGEKGTNTFEYGNYAGHNHVNGVCTVCGDKTYIIGNLNDDDKVDSKDAIYLLMSTLFPSDYPTNQVCDFDKDGEIKSNDAIYLLMYTLFPSDYPLE